MHNQLPPPPTPPGRRAQVPDYSRRPYAPPRSAWAVFGIVVAVVMMIAGLAVIGALVLFFVGMSHYGSNK